MWQLGKNNIRGIDLSVYSYALLDDALTYTYN